MTKLTKKAEKQFLVALAKGIPVITAAQGTGVTRAGFYKHRDVDEKFKEAWDEALEDGRQAKIAALETEADRRGAEGVIVGTFEYKGKVFPRKRFSDTLLLARLKKLDPEGYAKVDGNLNLNTTGLIVIGQSSKDAEEWHKKHAQPDDE